MRAMILNSFGPDAQFELVEQNRPQAAKGCVVVRVHATSVNSVDTMIRSMGEDLSPISPGLPALLGMDFAGVIEEIGDGVTGFAVGDEVYGCAGGLGDLPGALAQYIAADARLIARKPKSLSMRGAAALPLVGITAYEGLERAGLSKGQTVLVHGGTGGVGHIALQIAQSAGASVFSTGSDENALAIIEGYGATAIKYKTQSVADYVEQHTGGAGFDLVYDSVGGANMVNSFEAAGLNGQVATTVSMLELDMTPAHFKGLSIHVVFMLIPMLHKVGLTAHGEILAKIANLVDTGKLTPLLDEQRFSLEQVGAAYERLSSGQATGKVVIDVE